MTQPHTGQLTYVDHILAIFAADGDREAIVAGATRISYTQARDLILRCAEALRRAGLKKGDAVALASGNTPQALLVQMAVHFLGCKLVFVPAEPVPRERVSFVQRVKPDALIFDRLFGQGRELAQLTSPPLVYSIGPDSVFQDILALAEGLPQAQRRDVTPDDVVAIFYTGGTTGRPKMVLHKHNYYEALIFASGRRRAEAPGPQRFLVCTTVNHSSGQMSAIIVLLAGGTVLLMERFDAGEAISIALRERVTSLMVHPAMLYEVLDHPSFPPSGFPDLVRVFYGGGPASPARLQQAIDQFGPVLRQTYALTEVTLVTLMEPDEHDPSVPGRLGSCGKPLPGMTEIVVLNEDGEPVPAREIGEVCVRGKTLFAEYWKDPEATREAFRGGWFHTGDAGYFDEAGYLYLVDRFKDVICTGNPKGNVYCKLLEDLLVDQPGVRAAAVVGLPDERWGEAVHAVLMTEQGVNVDPDELVKVAAKELGPLYEPQSVVFVDSFPWTRVGKVDKKAIRANLLAARAEAPRAGGPGR